MKRFSMILTAGLGLAVTASACGNGADDLALEASGTVEATGADLGFQAPGRVAVIVPREGDAVDAGDTLARLDDAELLAARAAALAMLEAQEARLAELERGARSQELASAEAALRAAEQRSVDAGRDVERTRRLFEGGAVSRQLLDKATTALEIAEAQEEQAREAVDMVREGPRRETLEAQRAMVAQARANLGRADAALGNAVIVAPFAGLVTVRHREPGETVPPGSPVLTILDLEDRWVRIYVREDAVGRVSIGMGARISSDSYPGDTHTGEVFFIGSEAEFTPSNVQTPEERIKLVYPVKVRITGDDAFRLKPGIPADVVLVGEGA